ncbi:MAG: YraN family protein [Desulfobacteraceae bacterium]|nr:YraN family protein [Desulfobacteraceae bacterium]
MPGKRQRLGQLAEDAACRFLEELGFTIIERNYRIRAAEIDIIAKDGDTLVFLEVKARSTLSKGGPREAVGIVKQQKIVLGARHFIREKGLSDSRVRFDVVALYEKNNRFRIELIENAFQAE